MDRLSRPARILYVEGNYDGTVGGSYYSLLFLLEHLDRARFDSLLILRRDTLLMPRFKAAAGEVRIIGRTPIQMPFRRVPLVGQLFKAVQSAANLGRFGATIVRLSRVINQEGAQLVHLNNSVTSNHDWMLAAMLAGVPCISHERGLNDHYSATARWCAPRLARIICISQAVFDKLVERGVARDNLVMIHNGLDPERVVPGRSAEEVRRSFGIGENRRIIGMLGNIRAWKGQDVLVRALPAIVARVPNLTCLFVGEATPRDRDYESSLRQFIVDNGLESNVVFTGFCQNVADALNVMELAVHASVLPEPFGRVLLEAMALRKPVVGSRSGAVTEIVKEGETGLTFAPGHSAELAAHVIDLLEHPERATAFGEAGYRRLVDHFHIAANVTKTMTVYSEILQRV
jgi:glycosyltransferase involved in cell wall biosynthesis